MLFDTLTNSVAAFCIYATWRASVPTFGLTALVFLLLSGFLSMAMASLVRIGRRPVLSLNRTRAILFLKSVMVVMLSMWIFAPTLIMGG
jgi:hypothetical protein